MNVKDFYYLLSILPSQEWVKIGTFLSSISITCLYIHLESNYCNFSFVIASVGVLSKSSSLSLELPPLNEDEEVKAIIIAIRMILFLSLINTLPGYEIVLHCRSSSCRYSREDMLG